MTLTWRGLGFLGFILSLAMCALATLLGDDAPHVCMGMNLQTSALIGLAGFVLTLL